MKSTNPIIIDGEAYNHYAFTLAVSSKTYGESQLVLNLIPEKQDKESLENSKTILLNNSDKDEKIFDEINSVIQKYINAKNL